MGSASGVKVTVSALVLLALLHVQSCKMVAAVTKCSSNVKCLSASYCCSVDGYCGTSSYYCGAGCQNGPCYERRRYTGVNEAKEKERPGDVHELVTEKMFKSIFPDRKKFYSYKAFVEASKAFPEFGSTGSSTDQKRDIAAFLAHIHHETAGLTTTSAGDTTGTFCSQSDAAKSFKCAPGKKYFGRGPMQLTWNYNYGSACQAVGADILAEPEKLSTENVISFKSALWVWMSSPFSSASDAHKKPSSHQVMVGQWTPSPDDIAAKRNPGFGATINVLKGSEECGHASDAAESRIETYLQITDMLGVSPGHNLDCATMLPF